MLRKGRPRSWHTLLVLGTCCLGCAYSVTTTTTEGGINGVGDGDHKALWPLDKKDYATLVLASVGLIVSAAGGIGGGGILVPLYILVLGMDTRHAIPLSNITILGGAIANGISAVYSRHPHADRPLLDWDVILMMEPMTIVGAVVGAFLNKVLPCLVVSVLLVVVLGAMSRRTLEMGVRLFKKEGGWKVYRARRDRGGGYESLLAAEGSEAKEEMRDSSTSSEEDEEGGMMVEYPSSPHQRIKVVGDEESLQVPPLPLLPPLPPLSQGRCSPPPPSSSSSSSSSSFMQPTPEARAIAAQERTTALWKPLSLTLCFLGVVALDLIKGTRLLGIQCGSLQYWVTSAAIVPWVGAFFVFFRSRALGSHKAKVASAYVFDKGDVLWTPTNTIKYPVLCASAGLVAGIFGLGGGIVKGPIMLEIGVLPAVAAASASVMILYTSASASASYYVFHLIPLDYGLVFFVWGFVCTGMGRLLANHIIRRYHKESIVVLSISGVILLSALLMAYNSIVDIVHDPHGAMLFSPLCGPR